MFSLHRPEGRQNNQLIDRQHLTAHFQNYYQKSIADKKIIATFAVY
jgi:hypothetical protein